MNPASKPRWQQAAALVSLGAGGAVTGFSFIPGTVADAAAPPITQIRLLALRQAARAQPSESKNGMLRSAIVNVAQYYLRLAATKTPAEMEALIWQRDSPDGVDHGQSCAAFASLTLELAAQVVGQQSWVTGGSSYPWPLQDWADARVDPNPDSLQIMSVLQDAQAQHRWRPIGDGYQPQAGDWVMFDGHVEVVTSYASGVLDTIGGDSLPDFSVNAHQYSGPLAGQGVTGFVNNGDLADAAGQPGAPAPGPAGTPGGPAGSGPSGSPAGPGRPSSSGTVADAAVPGTDAPVAAGPAAPAVTRTQPSSGTAIPGLATPAAAAAAAAPKAPARPKEPADPGTPKPPEAQGPAAASAIPGVPAAVAGPAGPGARGGTARPAASAAPYGRHQPTAAATSPQGSSQQAFIGTVAAGAVAAQRRYGVPAAVTIAQAIDESAWGQSVLASRDHNLFGIKGIGPGGSDRLPTQEYVDGQAVSVTSSFRVYRNDAESIDDHGRLLATSGYYRQAMSYRQNPNAFAAALTGVYATDPHYGAKIISLMSEYDLYRFDSTATAPAAKQAPTPAADLPGSAGSAIPGLPAASPSAAPSPSGSSAPTSPPASTPTPPSSATPPATTPPAAAPPTPTPPVPASPAPTPTASAPPAPGSTPSPGSTTSPATPSRPRRPRPTPTSAQPGAGRVAPLGGAGRPAPATRPGSSGTPTAAAADSAEPGAPVTPATASTGTRAAGAAVPPVAPASQAATAAVPGAPSPPAGPAAPAGPMTAEIPATSAAPTTGFTAAAVSPAAPRVRAKRRGPGLLSDMARPFARATPASVAPASAVAAQAAPARLPAAPALPARPPAAQPSGPRRPAAQPPGPRRPAAQPPAAQSPAAQRAVTQVPADRRPAAQRPPAQPPAAQRPPAQRPPAQRPSPSAQTVSTRTPRPVHPASPASGRSRRAAGAGASARPSRYRHQMPASVTTAFLTSAQLPLLREEPLYRDVAGQSGIRWELLAACDWMQCRARPRLSPVHGEKLGATNSDGTVYRTRSEALEQCAEDLADLAWAVYRIDVCAPGALSVRDLANVYAAFRWGGLLKLHRTSAMEFPYSVAGLTGHLLSMRWPNIAEPNAPDRPGTRFRMPFGAVPVVLSLDYPAIA